MGLTFRKSIKLGGGTRLNLSSSGIGLSLGVKGFRVSTGTRGTFVTIGGHGIYYREKIGDPVGASKNTEIYDRLKADGEEQITPSSDALELVSSESRSVLAKINETTNLPSSWPAVTTMTFITSIMFLNIVTIGLSSFNRGAVALQINPASAFIIFIAAIIPTFIVGYIFAKKDAGHRIYTIHYSLDDLAQQKYDNILNAIYGLNQNKRFLCVVSSIDIEDRKYDSGADSHDTCLKAKCSYTAPPFLETNVKPICLDLGRGNQKLYFMPDRIYVYEQGEGHINNYGAVEYSDVSVDYYTKKIVMDLALAPDDSEIVGKTYDKVNKDGSRDKRFKYNPDMIICRVGRIKITSLQGLNILLEVGNAATSKEFVEAFTFALSNAPGLNRISSTDNQSDSSRLVDSSLIGKRDEHDSSQPAELIEGGYLPCPHCGYLNTPLDEECGRCHTRLVEAFTNDKTEAHYPPTSNGFVSHTDPAPKPE